MPSRAGGRARLLIGCRAPCGRAPALKRSTGRVRRAALGRADRQRQGWEVALTWDDRGDLPFRFSPVAAMERTEAVPSGALATRSLLGFRAGLKALWARGRWGVSAAPDLEYYPGSTRAAGTT